MKTNLKKCNITFYDVSGEDWEEVGERLFLANNAYEALNDAWSKVDDEDHAPKLISLDDETVIWEGDAEDEEGLKLL